MEPGNKTIREQLSATVKLIRRIEFEKVRARLLVQSPLSLLATIRLDLVPPLLPSQLDDELHPSAEVLADPQEQPEGLSDIRTLR